MPDGRRPWTHGMLRLRVAATFAHGDIPLSMTCDVGSQVHWQRSVTQSKNPGDGQGDSHGVLRPP